MAKEFLKILILFFFSSQAFALGETKDFNQNDPNLIRKEGGALEFDPLNIRDPTGGALIRAKELPIPFKKKPKVINEGTSDVRK